MSIRIGSSQAALRDPFKSTQTVIGYKKALSCDGSECGLSVFSEDGKMELVQPHWHLIVIGKAPEAGPRIYPICVDDSCFVQSL